MLVKVVSIDEEFEKARTLGAKDKKPRRKGVFYEVHGTDGKDWYKLGFTGSKKAFTKQALKGGWKSRQLKFTEKTKGE